MKINTYSLDEDTFLQRCKNIAKTPKRLYSIGKLPQEPIKTVAIVGSRRPTGYGREVTQSLARDLAKSGVIVISGMAIGIDAIAHTAALDAGGTTVAVLPSSVEDPYPKTNRLLARRIVSEGGALISEYEPGSSPMQHNFLERNRLVSALSDVVVVTEANIRSGTLSTVSHALEQGRTVLAVPGNITSPLSAGCNHLIKQGAAPVTSASDILMELGVSNDPQTALAFGDNDQETTLIALIKEGIQDGDELQQKSKLDPSKYSQTMTMLEIKGVIRPLGGNLWTIAH